MNLDKRREKGPNYTRHEKHLLLDKVLPHLSIIENKKTDSLTVDVKVKSWNKVAAQYNMVNTKAPRRVAQLKTLYENMKKRTRKDILTQQAAIKVGAGQAPYRKIDDVGWRLIKTVPSLKALWKNTLLITKQEGPGDNNLKNVDDPLATVEDNEISDKLEPLENIDYSVVVKEEVSTDIQEFLTPVEIAGPDNVQNDILSPSQNGCLPQISESVNDVNDNNEVNCSQLQQSSVSGFKVCHCMYGLEKEMKRKELEKLDLDVQMKRVELELMKGRLREQELNLKFRELEYEIKRKELMAFLNE